jgi:hypothetical protein
MSFNCCPTSGGAGGEIEIKMQKQKKTRRWWWVATSLIIMAVVASVITFALNKQGGANNGEGGDKSFSLFPVVKASTTRPTYLPLSHPLKVNGQEFVLWPIPGQMLVVLDPEAVAIWIYNTESGRQVFGKEAQGGPGMAIEWSASEEQAGKYHLVVVHGRPPITSSTGKQDRDLIDARNNGHDLFVRNLVVMLCGSPGMRSGC